MAVALLIKEVTTLVPQRPMLYKPLNMTLSSLKLFFPGEVHILEGKKVSSNDVRCFIKCTITAQGS